MAKIQGSPQPVATPTPTPTPKPSKTEQQPSTPSKPADPTAGDLFEQNVGKGGSVATIAGAPLDTATNLAKSAAEQTRTWANAAKGKAAQVFVEGGEQALQASGMHRAAANLESAAQRTAQTASRLNKAGKALGVVGGAMTAIDQGLNSSAQTDAGRVISATSAGTASYALGAAHPYLAAADAVAGLAGAPDTPSNVLNKSIDTIVTVGEGLTTGDTRGMENLHQRNLRGDNGPVFQAAAEAGDFWAEHGVVGGLKEFWNAIW